MSPSNERPFQLLDPLARAAVPLAAWAAMVAYAVREADPTALAEGRYLALLAAAALLAVAALAPAPAWEAGLGAVLAVTAVWALPAGPGRGAALVLLLAAVLAVAAVRRLARDLPGLSFEAAIPLALGAQLLLRGELLLAPALSPRTLVALLVLPLAGAAAMAVLAQRHGAARTLIATGTALLLAPGWNVAATLALLALAAGDLLGRSALGKPVRGAALLVLLAPIAWQPGPGLAAAAAGLALAWPRLALALSVPLAAGLWLAWPQPVDLRIQQVLWLPLLLPAVLLPGRDRVWIVPTAVLLAAATPPIPDMSPLAAALALAALAQRPEGPAVVAQRVWTGSLLFGVFLLSSYPWLRDEPLPAVLGLLGLEPGVVAAAVVMGGWLVIAALALRPGFTPWATQWRPPGSTPEQGSSGCEPGARLGAAVAGFAIFLALLLHIPPATKPLLPFGSAVLDAAHPAWEVPLAGEAGEVGAVVLESSLSNGAALAAGTPVAVARLRGADGMDRVWMVRAGMETGEWAARRPDVERTSRLRSPAGWVSFVAGDFFGQRYRAWWRLGEPGRFARLRIERSPGLPADLVLALHQVEVRP